MNRRLANTILAMITGNLADAGHSATMVIDPSDPLGTGSGLLGRSLVKCYNLATVRQARILQVIGHLSAELEQKLNGCLKTALGLP